jgi:hypothetical protein
MSRYNINGEYIKKEKELFTDMAPMPIDLMPTPNINPMLLPNIDSKSIPNLATISVPNINVIKLYLNNIFLFIKTNETITIDLYKQFDDMYNHIKIIGPIMTNDLNIKKIIDDYKLFSLEKDKNKKVPSTIMINFISKTKQFIKPEYKEMYEELLEIFNIPTIIQSNIKETFADTTNVETIKTNLNNFILLLKNNENLPLDQLVEYYDNYNKIKIKETDMDVTLKKQYVDTQVYLSGKYESVFLDAVDTDTFPSSVFIDIITSNKPFIQPEYRNIINF